MRVRPYEPSDRTAVRHVCNETGHLGDPIDPYFADREIFADLHSSYYTDVETDSSFVVDDGSDVVGYLLGCADTRRYLRWVSSYLQPSIMRRGLIRAVPVRPGTAPTFWRFIADLVRERPRIAGFDASHPAHLHINLLPQARKRGLGGELIATYLGHLRSLGIGGVFLETTVENSNAVRFFESRGFSRFASTPAPGVRAADGSRLHVLRMAREL